MNFVLIFKKLYAEIYIRKLINIYFLQEQFKLKGAFNYKNMEKAIKEKTEKLDFFYAASLLPKQNVSDSVQFFSRKNIKT